MASSTRFTDDILIEIFVFLPLNSIYKFRCLAKVWLSNLSDPNFITKWFQINKKYLPWIHYHTIYNDSLEPSNLKSIYVYPYLHSKFISGNDRGFSFKFLLNEKPFHLEKVYLLSSSNGLVLCCSRIPYEQRKYHVSNPFTQKWVPLPSPPAISDQFDVDGVFCHCEYLSSSASCFKVVRIPVYKEPSKNFNVEMFCSDLGAWGSLEVSCDENISWGQFIHHNVVTLKGVLYWIEGRNRLLAYDLNQENRSNGHRCCLINLPDDGYGVDEYKYHCQIIIGESEERVCCARIRWTGMELTLSVWVLDDVTWQVLHMDISIGDTLADKVCSWIGDGIGTIHVLGFSPVDRNVVLLGRKHWVCTFHILNGSVEHLSLDHRYAYHTGRMCKPFVLKPMPTVLPPPTWISS